MKKQSNLSRLLDYAGSYKMLTYLSWMLAVIDVLTYIAGLMCSRLAMVKHIAILSLAKA